MRWTWYKSEKWKNTYNFQNCKQFHAKLSCGQTDKKTALDRNLYQKDSFLCT